MRRYREILRLANELFGALSSLFYMGSVVTIKLCRVCEKSHANPLRAPVHLINLNGKLMLVDVWGDVVCPSCRIRWKREPASHPW